MVLGIGCTNTFKKLQKFIVFCYRKNNLMHKLYLIGYNLLLSAQNNP
mgnify:CR=1 FL=1